MTHPKPVISIRYGAAHDDITVDGRKFVRSAFSWEDREKMRTLIVNGLQATGYFPPEMARFRQKKRRKKATR